MPISRPRIPDVRPAALRRTPEEAREAQTQADPWGRGTGTGSGPGWMPTGEHITRQGTFSCQTGGRIGDATRAEDLCEGHVPVHSAGMASSICIPVQRTRMGMVVAGKVNRNGGRGVCATIMPPPPLPRFHCAEGDALGHAEAAPWRSDLAAPPPPTCRRELGGGTTDSQHIHVGDPLASMWLHQSTYGTRRLSVTLGPGAPSPV